AAKITTVAAIVSWLASILFIDVPLSVAGWKKFQISAYLADPSNFPCLHAQPIELTPRLARRARMTLAPTDSASVSHSAATDRGWCAILALSSEVLSRTVFAGRDPR